MVGWHRWLNGHAFEQAQGAGDGQGSLACCSPWGCRVRHNLATEQQEADSGCRWLRVGTASAILSQKVTQGKNCCFVQCALSTTCSESSSVPGRRANSHAQPKDTEPEFSRAWMLETTNWRITAVHTAKCEKQEADNLRRKCLLPSNTWVCPKESESKSTDERVKRAREEARIRVTRETLPCVSWVLKMALQVLKQYLQENAYYLKWQRASQRSESCEQKQVLSGAAAGWGS